jgi:branched-chain amino acid transport system ATP-binding protein
VAAEHEGSVLHVNDVSAGYGRVQVLHGVSLSVAASSVLALLGPNGAGKSTLLHTIAGMIKPRSGRITLLGQDITGADATRVSRAGVCLIPEGRGVFRTLTVRENLRLQVPRRVTDQDTAKVLQAFPQLGDRLGQLAGSLSGGQQQMLALARAYMSDAEVILLDEVSLGLAPIIVDQMFQSVQTLKAEGVAVVLVEQYVTRALAVADQVCVLSQGAISYDGTPVELDEAALMKSYLGTGQHTDAANTASAGRNGSLPRPAGM